MALVADRCICLRNFEYSETSQILSLLTAQRGIVRVMAKGAHRRTKAGASKFDGGIDLLDEGTAVFTDDTARDLATLTEWKLHEGRPALRRNLRAMYLGLYGAELTSALLEEHDPHPAVFIMFQQTLAELTTPRVEEAFLAYELDLLTEAGYVPQLAACVSCGSTWADRDAVYFSPARGGMVCRNCETAHPDRVPVDVRLLRLLQQIQSPATGVRRLPRLTRHQTDPLNRLLAEHIEQTVGKRLRLPPYVLTRQPSESRNPNGGVQSGRTTRII